jgi:hypothetical protein
VKKVIVTGAAWLCQPLNHAKREREAPGQQLRVSLRLYVRNRITDDICYTFVTVLRPPPQGGGFLLWVTVTEVGDKWVTDTERQKKSEPQTTLI